MYLRSQTRAASGDVVKGPMANPVSAYPADRRALLSRPKINNKLPPARGKRKVIFFRLAESANRREEEESNPDPPGDSISGRRARDSLSHFAEGKRSHI